MELTKEVKINRKIQGDIIDNSCKLKQKFGLFRNFLFTAQQPKWQKTYSKMQHIEQLYIELGFAKLHCFEDYKPFPPNLRISSFTFSGIMSTNLDHRIRRVFASSIPQPFASFHWTY
jgi:hypothetical protein